MFASLIKSNLYFRTIKDTSLLEIFLSRTLNQIWRKVSLVKENSFFFLQMKVDFILAA